MRAIKRVCECFFSWTPLREKRLVYSDPVDYSESPVMLEPGHSDNSYREILYLPGNKN